MRSVKLTIGTREIDMPRVTAEFRNLARASTRASRKWLKEHNKNTTGNLSKSIGWEVDVDRTTSKMTFRSDIRAPYWAFVEYGVQGFISSKKAPESPFKFGSMTGPRNGLNPAIDRWVIRKGLPGFRNEAGRFVPRKEQVRQISRKIFLYGIEPSPFASEPLGRLWPKYHARIQTAYREDIEAFMREIFGEEYILKIKN